MPKITFDLGRIIKNTIKHGVKALTKRSQLLKRIVILRTPMRALREMTSMGCAFM